MKITAEILKKLVTEAIHDRIKGIHEAGDTVAKESKIAKLDEERNVVEAAKSHFQAAADILKDYVNPKSIDNIMVEIDQCLAAIEAEKNALMGIKKEKVVKGGKPGDKKKVASSEPKKTEKPAVSVPKK